MVSARPTIAMLFCKSSFSGEINLARWQKLAREVEMTWWWNFFNPCWRENNVDANNATTKPVKNICIIMSETALSEKGYQYTTETQRKRLMSQLSRRESPFPIANHRHLLTSAGRISLQLTRCSCNRRHITSFLRMREIPSCMLRPPYLKVQQW